MMKVATYTSLVQEARRKCFPRHRLVTCCNALKNAAGILLQVYIAQTCILRDLPRCLHENVVTPAGKGAFSFA
jgi:hypothetical protein